jgi:Metal binding domain of Ada
MKTKIFNLVGPDGNPYESTEPGLIGGYMPRKIYGQLNCPNALRWVARGHYEKGRVFFKNEETAKSAGFRPCSICMPDQYREWKLQEIDKF